MGNKSSITFCGWKREKLFLDIGNKFSFPYAYCANINVMFFKNKIKTELVTTSDGISKADITFIHDHVLFWIINKCENVPQNIREYAEAYINRYAYPESIGWFLLGLDDTKSTLFKLKSNKIFDRNILKLIIDYI